MKAKDLIAELLKVDSELEIGMDDDGIFDPLKINETCKIGFRVKDGGVFYQEDIDDCDETRKDFNEWKKIELPEKVMILDTEYFD